LLGKLFLIVENWTMPLYFEINRTVNFAMKYGRGSIRIQGSSDRKAVGYTTQVYVVHSGTCCTISSPLISSMEQNLLSSNSRVIGE
jgi:hypothetical protein